MQKQITFTNIKANFTKSFETFGKMDPFLLFFLSRNEEKRTKTAENAGKRPEWNQAIVINYVDESNIVVKALEQDMTTNQEMGEGLISLKILKEKGQLEIPLSGQEGEVGIVSCTYSIKTLPHSPFLIIKSIVCQFYKEQKFLLKTSPFFQFRSNVDSVESGVKKEESSKKIIWTDPLRLKIRDSNKIQMKFLDKDDQNMEIFSHQLILKEWKVFSGEKKIYVNDKKYDPFGAVTIQFETLNYVTKDESLKNEQKFKVDEGSLNSLKINNIKGRLPEAGNDIYIKILCGPNKIMTKQISDAKKSFQYSSDSHIYAETKQSFMTLAVFDKDLIKDDLLGVGYISLENLSSGVKDVELFNGQKKQTGSLQVKIQTEKVISKKILLSKFELETEKSQDIIGESDSFVIASVGGWNGRTQTVSGQRVSFSNSIELFYSSQKTLNIEIWDEDVYDNEKVLSSSITIEQLAKKAKVGSVTLELTSQSSKKKGGKIYFSYEFFVNGKQEKQVGGSLKKMASIQKNASGDNIKKNILTSEHKEKDEKVEKVDKEVIKKTINTQKSPYVEEGNTLRLPPINIKNYGDSIYENQSSSTLQHSVHCYSMPRAERFPSRTKYVGEPSYYNDSSFKKNPRRGFSFGFGEKQVLPSHVLKNMKENPAPGAYNVSPNKVEDRRGKTFGVSRVFYEKVFVPSEKVFFKHEPTKRMERGNQ